MKRCLYRKTVPTSGHMAISCNLLERMTAALTLVDNLRMGVCYVYFSFCVLDRLQNTGELY